MIPATTLEALDALPDQSRSFPAMAGEVTVRTSGPADGPAFELVRAVFAAVEAQCTRFDPSSPLMQANAAGDEWCVVPGWCFAALKEAAAAHELTAGAFDPRVMTHLVALGYDRTLPFGRGRLHLRRPAEEVSSIAGRWKPSFDDERQAVRIGPHPVDLGGIGKGLALRWATELVREQVPGVLIEAGGDCWLGGDGPAPPGWQVAVEDPRGGTTPIAVLALRDVGCATSSIRIRRWTVGDRDAHHLIDPRTGEPGGAGLLAVTVVHPDPATAEVMSKAIFLAGGTRVAAVAAAFGAAALWVGDTGQIGMTEEMESLVVWQSRT